MKKINFLIVPALILIGATATLALTNQTGFTDQDNFADWFKSSALRMNSIGVVQGLPNGSFSPEGAVNRAQLVVMLDRFEQHINTQISEKTQAKSTGAIYKTLSAYEYLNDLESEEGKIFDLKPELAMAESNLSRLDGVPEINTEFYDFSKMENYTLPAGYEAYKESLKELPYEGIFPTTIYLHYKGERFNGDDIPHSADEWYGPFSNQDFGVYK